MTGILIDLDEEINFREILFRPHIIHKEILNNFENNLGNEIDIELNKAYYLVCNNFDKFNNEEDVNKSYSIVLLSDGLTTLTNVFHSSFIGYAVEPSILLRYYIECIGLAYGIYVNMDLFQEWKNNAKNMYANYFTKKGLEILYNKYPEIKAMWESLSEISHLEYNSTRTTYLEKDKITIGGYHSKNRDIIINININAAKLMLKVTNSIFGEDLNLA